MYSQTIRQIKIDGYKEFSVSTYLSWLNIKSGDKYQSSIADSAKQRLITGLIKNGFYHALVNVYSIPTDSNSTEYDLNIIVNEGAPTFINKIYYRGIDSLDLENIQSTFQFLEGEWLTKDYIEKSIADALNYFENRGFPFASIRVESIFFFDDSIDTTHYADIYFTFHLHQTSTIDEIKINGNTKTKDYVIIRNSRIKIGDPYSQIRIKDIPKLLNRLRFFEPVTEPNYYFNSNGRSVLEIFIKEKETNAFDGIVGYVPSSREGEKGFFTGFVNINLRNLFGTGRAASIKWQKEDRESQELEVKYFEPWLFDYPFNIHTSLNQRKQDTTYVQRKIEGSIEFLATDDISASILLGTESVIPTDPDTKGFTVFNSTSLITGANLKIDTRDDPYAPTEGLMFVNTYKFSSKKINGPGQFITSDIETRIELQRLELDLTGFYELFNRQIIAGGVHAREMRGGLIEISDLYRLGGTNTLRGYRENQFLGNRIFWSNLEYRYLLTRRSFAFLFFDTGYYLRNADKEKNISKLSSFNYGYGLGISLETALGVMAVSFALGENDSFTEGKIHIGLLNEF